MPTDFRVVDQGCGSVDTTFTTSLWAQRFLTGHLSESEGNQPDFNPCSGTGTGYSCTFDLAGWQPGTSGVYAIRQYSQHLSATSDGCGPNSSNCFFGDTDETTTLQLRHAIK